MKLINKTILYYLLISVPLLLLSGVFAYFRIQIELNDETYEALEKDLVMAESIIVTNADIKDRFIGFDSLSSIKIVPNQKYYVHFSDTMIYSHSEKEMIPYGFIKECLPFNGKTYLISVYKSTLEKEDLLESLFSTFILIVVFLILALFIVNWWIAKKLWLPFYNTLCCRPHNLLW